MTTPFDPKAYENVTTEATFETSFTPVPEGEYPAVVDDVKMDVLTMQDKSQRLIARIIWSILDDAVKAALNMQKVIVRQDVFIDLTPDGRFDTDKNKNIDLGRLRSALGQNNPGQAWGIPMLRGAGPAKIKVATRVDKNDETKVYNDVKGVTKLAA